MAGLDLDMELLDILSRVRLETLASRMGSGDERAGRLVTYTPSRFTRNTPYLFAYSDLLVTYPFYLLIISTVITPHFV